jgi:hypothetical protein
LKKIRIEELRNIGYTIDERNSRLIGKVDAILVLKNGKLELVQIQEEMTLQ